MSDLQQIFIELYFFIKNIKRQKENLQCYDSTSQIRCSTVRCIKIEKLDLLPILTDLVNDRHSTGLFKWFFIPEGRRTNFLSLTFNICEKYMFLVKLSISVLSLKWNLMNRCMRAQWMIPRPSEIRPAKYRNLLSESSLRKLKEIL